MLRSAFAPARRLLPAAAVRPWRAFASVDSRQAAEAEDEVLAALRSVIDPDLNKDVVTLGFIKKLAVNPSEERVSFDLQLTTPACPVKDELKAAAEAAVCALPWVSSADVTLTAAKPQSPVDGAADGLASVSNVIAVSSCKGGVGKSTVAVNLAFSLAAMGGRVGLFDADIYGPSLPTMVAPADAAVMRTEDGKRILPVEVDGVRCMSYGWVARGSGDGGSGAAAVMRGPMVTNVVNQLLAFTEWGELDYLVVDFPPGTGDIQITLCQQLSITAAMIVTTPQKLSFVDVVKGVDMFESLKVPTIGVVENMAHFDCDAGKRYYPFGPGHRDRLVEQYGLPYAYSMPIHGDFARAGDSGLPLVLSQPESPLAKAYGDVASDVVREVSILRHRQLYRPAVLFQPSRGLLLRLMSERGAEELSLDAADLRRRCRCAACVDEWTGTPLLKEGDVPDDVVPVNIEPKGNYAVAIDWSDGHDSSIYPYSRLESLARASR